MCGHPEFKSSAVISADIAAAEIADADAAALSRGDALFAQQIAQPLRPDDPNPLFSPIR
jgi:hypothetical protein